MYGKKVSQVTAETFSNGKIKVLQKVTDKDGIEHQLRIDPPSYRYMEIIIEGR